ncbi:MAG: uracil-DNA glycosylase [Anaerolineaceae bacterium]|nr:uracil-DNA glycosylase [Anaerolineaceae bacterium]
MKIDSQIQCLNFPCMDIKQEVHQIPSIDLDPQSIRMVLISESVPKNPRDDYYQPGNPGYERTTLTAFKDAGVEAKSIQELVEKGIYFTSAVKCAKTAYTIQSATIKECSFILEKELALFPNLKVIMLMGDVAIKALNTISLHRIKQRIIPDGATYKIRNGKYTYNDMRVFPSYLQAGPSFNIEKSKRRMIAEDITNALKLLG